MSNLGIREEKLSEWYKKRLARPTFVIVLLMISLQLLLIVYQQKEKDAELRNSVESLSKIFSLAISQKNRPMIEMSAAFAMQNSGLKRICIFDDSNLQYTIPFERDNFCDIRSDFFFKAIDIVPSSQPHYRFKILQPRFPGARDNLALLFGMTVLVLPIYFTILNIRKVIESDLLRPLMDSINSLDFDGLSRILKEPRPFRISELNELIKAHYEKLVAIGEHIARESELQKDATIGRVISQLSHDLRAPLGSIERLLYQPVDCTIHSVKATIAEALHRMHSMIEGLRRSDLDLIIARKSVELDLNRAFDGLRHKADKKLVQLHVRTSITGALWVDVSKFERACMNLVSNAIDFGKSEVRIEIEESGKELIVRVIDDGAGVPDEILPKLFQRGATYGKTDGTGLGLAYVRQIMRGHGGDVTYRREKDLTIFECRLPNAVQPEKEQVVKNDATLETRLVQKMLRSVAICLEPKALTQSILAKLASYNSGDFLFIEEQRGASIVVSNIDEVMFEVLERDDQEYVAVAHLRCDEAAILKILKRKFNLDIEGNVSV